MYLYFLACLNELQTRMLIKALDEDLSVMISLRYYSKS